MKWIKADFDQGDKDMIIEKILAGVKKELDSGEVDEAGYPTAFESAEEYAKTFMGKPKKTTDEHGDNFIYDGLEITNAIVTHERGGSDFRVILLNKSIADKIVNWLRGKSIEELEKRFETEIRLNFYE